MSDIAIKVEDLSKQYRLGQVGTGTLRHDLNRLWHTLRGKEDPYLKIGQTNDRTKKAESDFVWALKDINFEVKKGEVLGIIGRNGAGKSTLLKILSKITAPTTGQITINGRIASLLEVGTGFHPELSGRENIFLNGAILGMRKWEIQKKFDEIVDFAGVEAYIDTPVKRYSSGMYVRLAFAVAAFLEPEILIVDEVLAVGDAEFQKKCLGRMKDVSENNGRTVLFVSHNMEAILKLCSKTLLLNNGTLSQLGNSKDVINKYQIVETKRKGVLDLTNFDRGDTLKKNVLLKSIILNHSEFSNWQIKYRQPLSFSIEYEVINEVVDIEIGLAIYTHNDFEIVSSLTSDYSHMLKNKKGVHRIMYLFNNLSLLPNTYKISLGVRSNYGFEDYLLGVEYFDILISNESAFDKTNTRKGVLIPEIEIVHI